jgi:hypothetical protein
MFAAARSNRIFMACSFEMANLQAQRSAQLRVFRAGLKRKVRPKILGLVLSPSSFKARFRAPPTLSPEV